MARNLGDVSHHLRGIGIVLSHNCLDEPLRIIEPVRFKNFSIWRGRLPHWRADDVQYYVTFRHRRELTTPEMLHLFRALLRPEGRKWDLVILCVLPESTELIFSVREGRDGRPVELADVVEKAKNGAGKAIIKQSGERFPPFYQESFDRILRDEAELEDRWNAIFSSPESLNPPVDPDDYQTLWVKGAPQ
jgi:hypothetical protein